MLLDFILAVFFGLISSAELAGFAFFIGVRFAGCRPWSSGLLRLLIIATGLALIDDLCGLRPRLPPQPQERPYV